MRLPRWARVALGIHSPSAHLLGTCWCGVPSAAATRRRIEQAALRGQLAGMLAAQRDTSEREAADERCGWTHCNGCCGPCPECGLEGADYGDPGR